MKILAIGDFHGKFPEKLKKSIKKEDFDFILCTGDFPDAAKIRKLIFKHWTSGPWWQNKGLKKARKMEKNCFDSGLKIIKKLDSVGKKAYTVWGNSDFYENFEELKKSMPVPLYPGDYDRNIKKLKNIFSVDRNRVIENGTEIIGYGGYVDVTDYIMHPIDKTKRKQLARLKRYRKDEKVLKKLFLKRKPQKNFIFLIHYAPYGVMDRVRLKSSPMHNKHVGWMPYNDIIKKYQPPICICGHMHEYQGKCRMGKTLVVNPGPAYEGKYAIIEINKKIRVKFRK